VVAADLGTDHHIAIGADEEELGSQVKEATY
jgi:hypothetical protein